ncbi:MAG: tetratricopeptide repeat protein, partial [Candidatus Omnitrophica bacterium]|nr:tetratricopeptide repeat protein [Candidatus Omnitrophota bacterium]
MLDWASGDSYFVLREWAQTWGETDLVVYVSRDFVPEVRNGGQLEEMRDVSQDGGDMELMRLAAILLGLPRFQFSEVINRKIKLNRASVGEWQELYLTAWGANIATVLHALITLSLLRALRERFPGRHFEACIDDRRVHYMDLSADFKGIKVQIHSDRLDPEIEMFFKGLLRAWKTYVDINFPPSLARYEYRDADRESVQGKFALSPYITKGVTRDALDSSLRVLGDWAYYDPGSRESIREYARRLEEVFHFSLKERNIPLDPVPQLPRTDPRNFNPLDFCFLVKSMIEDRKLEGLDIMAVSCIDESHPETFFGWGWIVDVPDENIAGIFAENQASGMNKKEEYLPYILWQAGKDRRSRTIQELLADTLPQYVHNEIIVRVRGIRIAGIFYHAGIHSGHITAARREAGRLNVPLVEIPRGRRTSLFLDGGRGGLMALDTILARLFNAGYSHDSVLLLRSGCEKMLEDVDAVSKKQVAGSLKGRGNELLLGEFICDLMQSLQEKGYRLVLNPLSRAMVNGFADEDIFVLLETARQEEERKEKLLQFLMGCSTSSLTLFLLLSVLGIETRVALHLEHLLLLSRMPDGTYLFIDQGHYKAFFVDMGRYYERRNDFYILKDKHDIALVDLQLYSMLKLDYSAFQMGDERSFASGICNNIGLVYYELGNFAKAREFFLKAIQCNGKYATAYCNLGNTYWAEGSVPGGLEAYTKAIEISPYCVKALCNRGVIWYMKNEIEKAIDDFTQAVMFQPDYYLAFGNAVRVYAEAGMHTDAQGFYRRFKDRFSEHADNYHRRYKDIYRMVYENLLEAGACGKAEEIEAAMGAFDAVFSHPEKQVSSFDGGIQDVNIETKASPGLNPGDDEYAAITALAVPDFYRAMKDFTDYLELLRSRSAAGETVRADYQRQIENRLRAILIAAFTSGDVSVQADAFLLTKLIPGIVDSAALDEEGIKYSAAVTLSLLLEIIDWGPAGYADVCLLAENHFQRYFCAEIKDWDPRRMPLVNGILRKFVYNSQGKAMPSLAFLLQWLMLEMQRTHVSADSLILQDLKEMRDFLEGFVVDVGLGVFFSKKEEITFEIYATIMLLIESVSGLLEEINKRIIMIDPEAASRSMEARAEKRIEDSLVYELEATLFVLLMVFAVVEFVIIILGTLWLVMPLLYAIWQLGFFVCAIRYVRESGKFFDRLESELIQFCKEPFPGKVAAVLGAVSIGLAVEFLLDIAVNRVLHSGSFVPYQCMIAGILILIAGSYCDSLSSLYKIDLRKTEDVGAGLFKFMAFGFFDMYLAAFLSEILLNTFIPWFALVIIALAGTVGNFFVFQKIIRRRMTRESWHYSSRHGRRVGRDGGQGRRINRDVIMDDRHLPINYQSILRGVEDWIEETWKDEALSELALFEEGLFIEKLSAEGRNDDKPREEFVGGREEKIEWFFISLRRIKKYSQKWGDASTHYKIEWYRDEEVSLPISDESKRMIIDDLIRISLEDGEALEDIFGNPLAYIRKNVAEAVISAGKPADQMEKYTYLFLKFALGPLNIDPTDDTIKLVLPGIFKHEKADRQSPNCWNGETLRKHLLALLGTSPSAAGQTIIPGPGDGGLAVCSGYVTGSGSFYEMPDLAVAGGGYLRSGWAGAGIDGGESGCMTVSAIEVKYWNTVLWMKLSVLIGSIEALNNTAPSDYRKAMVLFFNRDFTDLQKILEKNNIRVPEIEGVSILENVPKLQIEQHCRSLNAWQIHDKTTRFSGIIYLKVPRFSSHVAAVVDFYNKNRDMVGFGSQKAVLVECPVENHGKRDGGDNRQKGDGNGGVISGIAIQRLFDRIKKTSMPEVKLSAIQSLADRGDIYSRLVSSRVQAFLDIYKTTLFDELFLAPWQEQEGVAGLKAINSLTEEQAGRLETFISGYALPRKRLIFALTLALQPLRLNLNADISRNLYVEKINAFKCAFVLFMVPDITEAEIRDLLGQDLTLQKARESAYTIISYFDSDDLKIPVTKLTWKTKLERIRAERPYENIRYDLILAAQYGYNPLAALNFSLMNEDGERRFVIKNVKIWKNGNVGSGFGKEAWLRSLEEISRALPGIKVYEIRAELRFWNAVDDLKLWTSLGFNAAEITDYRDPLERAACGRQVMLTLVLKDGDLDAYREWLKDFRHPRLDPDIFNAAIKQARQGKDEDAAAAIIEDIVKLLGITPASPDASSAIRRFTSDGGARVLARSDAGRKKTPCRSDMLDAVAVLLFSASDCFSEAGDGGEKIPEINSRGLYERIRAANMPATKLVMFDPMEMFGDECDTDRKRVSEGVQRFLSGYAHTLLEEVFFIPWSFTDVAAAGYDFCRLTPEESARFVSFIRDYRVPRERLVFALKLALVPLFIDVRADKTCQCVRLALERIRDFKNAFVFFLIPDITDEELRAVLGWGISLEEARKSAEKLTMDAQAQTGMVNIAGLKWNYTLVPEPGFAANGISRYRYCLSAEYKRKGIVGTLEFNVAVLNGAYSIEDVRFWKDTAVEPGFGRDAWMRALDDIMREFPGCLISGISAPLPPCAPVETLKLLVSLGFSQAAAVKTGTGTKNRYSITLNLAPAGGIAGVYYYWLMSSKHPSLNPGVFEDAVAYAQQTGNISGIEKVVTDMGVPRPRPAADETIFDGSGDGGAIEIPDDLFSDKELYEIAQDAGYLFQKRAFVELGSAAAGKLPRLFEGVPPGAAKIGVEVKGRLQENGLDIRFILAPGGRCEYPSLHLSISKDESLQITLRLSSWSKTSSLKAANTVYLLERFDVADYAVDREGRKIILRPGEGKRGLRYIHFETKDNFEEHLGYFVLHLREHAEIIMESIRQGELKECGPKEGFPASCRVYSYKRPDGVTVRTIVDQENEVARALPLGEMSMLALTMQRMNKVMHFNYSREIDELVHDPKRVLTDADIPVLGDMFIETEKATLTSQLSGVLEEYPGEFIPLSLIFTNLPRESLIYFMLNTYSGDRSEKIGFREGYIPYDPQVSVDTESSRKVARELLRPEQDRDVQFLSILYAEDMVAFAAGVKAAKAQTEKQASGIERFTGAFYNTLRDVHWGGIMKELESAARKDETMQYQCMERHWQYFERTVDERPAEEQVDERNRFIGYMLEIEDPGLRDAVLTGFELYWRRSISYTNYVDCGMSGSLVPLESRLMELARAKGYFKTPFIQFVRAAEMKIATAGRGDAWYDLAYYFLDFVFSKPVLTGSEIAAVAEQVMAAERMSAGNGRKILEDLLSQAANIEIIPRLGDIDIENISFSFENTIFRGRNEYYFRVIDRVINRKDSQSERGEGDKRTVQERFIQAVRAHPEMTVEEFVEAPGAGQVFVDWITADVLPKGGCQEYVKWFVRTILYNARAGVPGIGAPMLEQDFVEFAICLLELRFASSLKRSELKPALRAVMDNVSEESVRCHSYIMKDGSNEDFELSLFYAEGRNTQHVRMELHIAGKDELIVEIHTRHSIFSRTLSGDNMKRLLALAGICWFTFQGDDAVKVFGDDLVSIMDERGMEFEPFGISDTAGLLAAVKKAVNTGKLRQFDHGWKKSVIYRMRMVDLGKGSSDFDLVVELGDGRVVKDVYPRKRKTRDEAISEMLEEPFQTLREALEEETSIGDDVGEDWGFEEDDLFFGFGIRRQPSRFGEIWEEFRPAFRKMRDMERAYLTALIWDVILAVQPASKRMAAARDFLESRMKEDINRNIEEFLRTHGIYPNEENSVLVEGIIRIYILTTHLDRLDGSSLLSDFLEIFTVSPCVRLNLLHSISGEVREASLMDLPFIKLYTADLIFFLAGIWPSGDIRHKKLDYSFCSGKSESVLSAWADSEAWQDTYFKDKAELLRNNAQTNGSLMDEEEKKGIAFAGTRNDIRIGDIHDYAWMAAVGQVIAEHSVPENRLFETVCYLSEDFSRLIAYLIMAAQKSPESNFNEYVRGLMDGTKGIDPFWVKFPVLIKTKADSQEKRIIQDYDYSIAFLSHVFRYACLFEGIPEAGKQQEPDVNSNTDISGLLNFLRGVRLQPDKIITFSQSDRIVDLTSADTKNQAVVLCTIEALGLANREAVRQAAQRWVSVHPAAICFALGKYIRASRVAGENVLYAPDLPAALRMMFPEHIIEADLRLEYRRNDSGFAVSIVDRKGEQERRVELRFTAAGRDTFAFSCAGDTSVNVDRGIMDSLGIASATLAGNRAILLWNGYGDEGLNRIMQRAETFERVGFIPVGLEEGAKRKAVAAAIMDNVERVSPRQGQNTV